MTDLGQIQATYKISKTSVITGLFFGIFSLCVPILFIVDWYIGGIKNYSSFMLILLILGVPFFLFGSFLLSRMPRMFRNRICIYENGIVLINVKGEYIASWHEIESIEQIVHRWVHSLMPERRQYSYKFIKKNGEEFRDYGGMLKNSKEIGKKLEVIALKFGIPIHTREIITRMR